MADASFVTANKMQLQQRVIELETELQAVKADLVNARDDLIREGMERDAARKRVAELEALNPKLADEATAQRAQDLERIAHLEAALVAQVLEAQRFKDANLSLQRAILHTPLSREEMRVEAAHEIRELHVALSIEVQRRQAAESALALEVSRAAEEKR